ncbi:MAG: hypothetical protein HXY20_13075 [Acidobacteria bacterium]|nr:hypothetical protein [Acidobacteriota bacterium]
MPSAHSAGRRAPNRPQPFLLGLVALLLLPPAGTAQTEFVVRDFFPAELEFKELGAVIADRLAGEPAAIAGMERGDLLLEAGCQRFQSRTYKVEGGGSLTVEVAYIKDGRGAYSLLTLFREVPITAGPPGEYLAAEPDHLSFILGAHWVRVRSADAQLARRVAISVSNRIGPRDTALPPLVRRLPRAGYEPGSLRYMLGPRSFKAYGAPVRGSRPQVTADLEVAQARYRDSGQTGILTLVGFPTGQLAEEFFDALAAPPAAQNAASGARSYARRVGPQVGILEGTFEPLPADKILGSLDFQYSIRWIYDKNNRSSATVWGVPVSLLGTVVRSLALTALLCVASLMAGFGIAVFRFLLRSYAPNNFLDRPERTEMIRLKLDEN